MAPAILPAIRRHFDPGVPSGDFSSQWEYPTDVFSVLLILGGDVVGRALAQLVGSRVTPVAFSFGWVAYAVQTVLSVIGEKKLIADPDYACKVINGRTGYVRDNSSWVIGRVVRDFDSWMHDSKRGAEIRTHLQQMLAKRWERDRRAAEDKKRGSGEDVPRPSRAGLLVSVFTADRAEPGHPDCDWVYILGFPVAILQLGVAAIPCGLFGDWSILLVTAAGILLAFGTGGIGQWTEEKWACRRNSNKTVILTRGNGSQHAIVIIGDGKGLDLEDLAAGPSGVAASTPYTTIVTVTILAVLWILLLITAAGIKQNTWFLIAVGAIGIVQNILVAGWPRSPEAFGIPLREEKHVFGEQKVMDTLFAVEDKYPRVGRSMLDTFFPGKLLPEEEERWCKTIQITKLHAYKKNDIEVDSRLRGGVTLPRAFQATIRPTNSREVCGTDS
ncbi:uncharacterized protein DNG_03134 [Cephalotrichum gorgonifer]|uniref:Uncharacterized protein n=1 Tax=Cephalotrichum gorgonifer TaxID=2041049 RepID=A0AAE8STP5_9PEZI|nr:uncharacterized protein DNG_03134 [Cephalotrichum gorgonifer]